MAQLKLRNINKIYDNNVQAVFDFNLDIHDKEFIVFVGPSGCGKSTTLRMIAGLEDITSGELYVDGELMNDILPKDRDMSMVFQSYALYPHMTVYKNMAFGLKLRKIPVPVLDESGNQVYTFDKEKVKELKREIKEVKTSLKKAPDEEKEELETRISELTAQIEDVKSNLNVPKYKMVHYEKEEIDRRVNNAAEILGLTDYLDRKPKALSGGQRQRVALGRSIVRDAKVFLMDEPLSNLDAKLRVQMRSEIAKIHKKVGATTIYVTHDQTEAMTMASRIVVMKDGYIQQIGTPREVYSTPANMFVGGFIGSPAMNFLKGKISNKAFVMTNEETNEQVQIELDDEMYDVVKDYENKDIVLGVRPEDIHFTNEALNHKPSNLISLNCDVTELLGYEQVVYGDIAGQRVIMITSESNNIELENALNISFDMSKIHFFDPKTTNRIYK